MLAGLGAKALATTSSGYAFTLGLPDGGQVSRDAMLAHCADMVAATDLPVSADLENGYGEAPDAVAETVRLAAEAGLAGCTIEDTALPGKGAYDFDLALERVKAATAAARSLGFPFMLTARADGYLMKSYDAAEALQALRHRRDDVVVARTGLLEVGVQFRAHACGHAFFRILNRGVLFAQASVLLRECFGLRHHFGDLGRE